MNFIPLAPECEICCDTGTVSYPVSDGFDPDRNERFSHVEYEACPEGCEPEENKHG